MKGADVIGACAICGLVVWFASSSMGQAPREQAAYERGKTEYELRQYQQENIYLKGRVEGLQYPR